MTDAQAAYVEELARNARAAALELATVGNGRRTAALRLAADRIDARAGEILDANARDLAAAEADGLSAALTDRLRLDAGRVAKVADGVRAVAAQPDPVGRTRRGEVRPNGLRVEQRAVPLGVVLFLYESRPNVTADAAALALRSGNVVILRGGKEARHSNAALADCFREALAGGGLPPATVSLVKDTDRALVPALLARDDAIDLAIPRGGESLIRAVVAAARMPVLKHFDGNCHVYVDASADPEQAAAIVLNAKVQRPGVCNALETLLIHADYPAAADLIGRLIDAGVEVRGDAAVRRLDGRAAAADEGDWQREYLDLIVAAGVVPDLAAAVARINANGSRHTDAIVTRDMRAAEHFVRAVDSASVMVNCSTRFADGGEYGLGAELGISTDKLHARGPMGADDLCSVKWVVTGDGQVRE